MGSFWPQKGAKNLTAGLGDFGKLLGFEFFRNSQWVLLGQKISLAVRRSRFLKSGQKMVKNRRFLTIFDEKSSKNTVFGIKFTKKMTPKNLQRKFDSKICEICK